MFKARLTPLAKAVFYYLILEMKIKNMCNPPTKLISKNVMKVYLIVAMLHHLAALVGEQRRTGKQRTARTAAECL